MYIVDIYIYIYIYIWLFLAILQSDVDLYSYSVESLCLQMSHAKDWRSRATVS